MLVLRRAMIVMDILSDSRITQGMIIDASSERLVVEIQNKQPVELIDMAESLVSLGAEYQSFLTRTEGIAGDEDIKLYVKEVRSGSAIFEMVAANVNLIPDFIKHGMTLCKFLAEIKKTVAFLRKDEGAEKPKTVTKRQLERIDKIVQPTAKDQSGGVTNIYYVERGGKIADTLTLNVLEANAVQNSIQREIAALREPIAGYHENCAIIFYQTRDDTQSVTGDKAVIERFGKSAVRTKFATAEVKARVLGIEGNIYHHAFIVDVRVETVEDRPVLYVITKVHDSIERPRQGDLPLLEG